MSDKAPNQPCCSKPGPTAGCGATPAPRPPTSQPHIHLNMLSCPRYLAGARELVASLSRRLGFDEVAACQIALAVDEALANVIRHGYERREDQPIWMSIWELPPPGPTPPPHCPPQPAVIVSPPPASGMFIIIEDQGRQTEPEAIKGRDLDDVRPGGLGVHIIREVMDEVVYEKRSGGGMRLTLVKRLQTLNDRADAHADAHGSPRGTSNG